jgi:O-antigen ligase
MNISLNNLRTPNLLKGNILFLCVVFFAIMTGLSIADGDFLYVEIMFIPLVIYICIIKPFIFPFGLYVLLLPFDNVLSIIGTATLTKFLGILTILILLFKGGFEKKLRRPDNAAFWWILFMIYAVFSLSWAIKSDNPFEGMPTVIGLFTFYLVVASYKIQKSDFDTLKVSILIGGFIAAVYVIYGFAIGQSHGVDVRSTVKVGESTSDPNTIAFSLLIPTSVCIQMIIENKNKVKKGLLWAVFIIILFSIIVTGSRGGLLGTGAIIIIYILSMKKRISYGIIFIILAIILLSFTPDYFMERWRGALDSGGAGRTTIWYVGFKSLEKYWAFGAGLHNFTTAYSEFAFFDISKGWDREAHNIYIEILVELGIVGFSLMILAMMKHYQIMQSRFVRYNSNSTMLKASFWAVLVSSFFLGTTWHKSFWLLWMLIIMYKNVVDKEIAAHKQELN